MKTLACFGYASSLLVLALASGCGTSTSSISSSSGRSRPSSRADSSAAVPASSSSTAAARQDAPFNIPATPPQPPPGEGWMPLFDGQSLTGWKITEFGGHGEVHVEKGVVRFEFGAALTGLTFTNSMPQVNYEISWQAMKVDGNDFFSALTAPFNDTHFTFVNGGWGGGVVGISSVDGQDASENETTEYIGFEKRRWYQFSLKVTPNRIEVFIDGDRTIDLEIGERRLRLRPGEIDLCIPLGFAAWQSAAAIRNVYLRPVASVGK